MRHTRRVVVAVRGPRCLPGESRSGLKPIPAVLLTRLRHQHQLGRRVAECGVDPRRSGQRDVQVLRDVRKAGRVHKGVRAGNARGYRRHQQDDVRRWLRVRLLRAEIYAVVSRRAHWCPSARLPVIRCGRPLIV